MLGEEAPAYERMSVFGHHRVENPAKEKNLGCLSDCRIETVIQLSQARKRQFFGRMNIFGQHKV